MKNWVTDTLERADAVTNIKDDGDNKGTPIKMTPDHLRNFNILRDYLCKEMTLISDTNLEREIGIHKQ